MIHDPDAPRRDGFAHWVVYNIPPKIAIIEPNVPGRAEVKGLGVHGRNDSGEIGYTGPCPPSGTHRYFARLYALRDKLDLPAGATYAESIAEMSNKIIEQAELRGTTYPATRSRNARRPQARNSAEGQRPALAKVMLVAEELHLADQFRDAL